MSLFFRSTVACISQNISSCPEKLRVHSLPAAHLEMGRKMSGASKHDLDQIKWFGSSDEMEMFLLSIIIISQGTKREIWDFFRNMAVSILPATQSPFNFTQSGYCQLQRRSPSENTQQSNKCTALPQSGRCQLPSEQLWSFTRRLFTSSRAETRLREGHVEVCKRWFSFFHLIHHIVFHVLNTGCEEILPFKCPHFQPCERSDMC